MIRQALVVAALGGALSAGLALQAGQAEARPMPVAKTVIAGESPVVEVRSRRNRRAFVAGALALGALGAAAAAAPAYGYDYGYDPSYGYAPAGGYAPAYGYGYPVGGYVAAPAYGYDTYDHGYYGAPVVERRRYRRDRHYGYEAGAYYAPGAGGYYGGGRPVDGSYARDAYGR